MMSINGVSDTGNQMPAGTGMNKLEDSVSKNIKKQIKDAQERLQEVSSNEDLSLEEKMKKRQEIQKEITTLNQQLRQHQIELRKEQQAEQKAQSSTNKERQQDAKGGGLSQAGMQAIISADSTLKQAQVLGSVSSSMEGRAGVLKAEIKQDKGQNTEAKEAELAKVEQKAMDTTASQMNTLAEANQALEDAKTAEPDSKRDKTVSETGRKAEEADGQTEIKKQEMDEVSEKKADVETVGTNVDVRL